MISADQIWIETPEALHFSTRHSKPRLVPEGEQKNILVVALPDHCVPSKFFAKLTQEALEIVGVVSLAPKKEGLLVYRLGTGASAIPTPDLKQSEATADIGPEFAHF
jgi:hypothetical protein